MPASSDAVDRRALASVGTQFFVNGAVFATFIPRLPEIRDRVGVTVGVLGVLLAGAGLSGLVSSAVAGPLIGRLGTRSVMVGAAAGIVVVLPVIGATRSPVVLLAALAAVSALDVLVDISMNLQGSWLSARRPVPVMNRLHGVWSLGTVVGGASAAALADAGVAPLTHFAGAALVMAGALVFVSRGLLRVDEHAGSDGSGRPSGGSGLAWTLPALAVAGGCALVVEITSSDWAAFRLTDDLGAAAGPAGLAYVSFTAGMTVGRLGGDAVQARLGAIRLFHVALGLAAVGLVASSLVPDRTTALVAYAIAGLGIAPLFPRLYDDAAQLPGRPGVGLGAMVGGSRIAGLIAPAVVGTLAATDLSVGAAALAVTAPCIAGLALVSRRPA